MMKKKWRIALLAVVCTFALILSNCRSSPNGGSENKNNSAADRKVLVYGSVGSPVNLEPGNISDGNSLIVQQQIYDRLVEFKPGTTDPQPGLATSWSVSADGKVWTFKLRPGVKFHDGTNFDAEAVKFNVERWWDAKHPNSYRNAGRNY